MAVNAIKTPFTNMSFTPDVPSSALSANEYNAGYNVETDVRSIKSVAGDQYILSTIPGRIIYITGGFRTGTTWYYVVATDQGKWYAIDDAGFTDVTPTQGFDGSGYTTVLPITEAWNGTVLFINDTKNAPMYLLPADQAGGSRFQLYSQFGGSIATTAATGDGTTVTLSFTSIGYVPFNIGDTIVVSGLTPTQYNGTYNVTASTATSVSYLSTATGAQTVAGSISPGGYIWNYYSDWSKLRAGFQRIYSSPKVGSLLVAGNLTADIISTGTTQNYPNTVRWSQAFGQNSGPTTWAPTAFNVANELEVPVRGPVIDGFPLMGNFYVCSYWDTVIFSPIAYQSGSTPVFGIKLISQGRGLINENCYAVVDNVAYGVDARDIWTFDGGTFKAIGDQRVKNWFYSNLNPAYTNQVFVRHNTKKYQIEIYYPDLNSTGTCNQMLAYRYDLDVWQPPRQVTKATMAVEGPQFTGNTFNLASRTITYSSFQSNVQLVQKDYGTSFLGNTAISSLFQRDNISFGQPYSASVQVHRVYPEVYGTGNITVTVGGSDAVADPVVYSANVVMPIVTSDPWVQIDQNEARVNTLQVQGNSAVDTWQMSAANWQVTIVQETR